MDREKKKGLSGFTFSTADETLGVIFWEKRDGTNVPNYLTEAELEALRAKASIEGVRRQSR